MQLVADREHLLDLGNHEHLPAPRRGFRQPQCFLQMVANVRMSPDRGRVAQLDAGRNQMEEGGFRIGFQPALDQLARQPALLGKVAEELADVLQVLKAVVQAGGAAQVLEHLAGVVVAAIVVDVEGKEFGQERCHGAGRLAAALFSELFHPELGIMVLGCLR